MTPEIDFHPAFITIDCRSGNVKVGYTISLETESFDGMIGGSDGTEVMSDEIAESVKALMEEVSKTLRDMVGLHNEESALSDPSAEYDDEDPL